MFRVPIPDLLPALLNAFELGGIQADTAQRQALIPLAAIAEQISRQSRRATWRRALPAPRSLYLWGGVGRGKTRLMDALKAALPTPLVKRFHQHVLLAEFHRLADLDWAGRLDRLLGQARLLLIDEFHAYDIADAAILDRLFRECAARRIALIFTANHPPQGLWPAGRAGAAHFHPLAAWLHGHCDLIHVDGGQDYRLIQPPEADPQDNTPAHVLPLAELLNHPRAPQDFDHLTCQHPAVHLQGPWPRFTPRDGDALRRLIWFLDAAWENRTRLFHDHDTPSRHPDFTSIGPDLDQLLGKDLKRSQSRLIGLMR